MYNKIVDMVAVTARTKPMGGGKCEQWWRENSTGRHGLDRKAFNRSASGRTIPGAMSPSVEETLTRFKFREIKRKGGLPKPGTEAWQPLERWLAHYDSLEGKRRGLGIYKSYKIISRTKYSIRYRNNKGEYIESYIVGEDGKRLKEPAPKKKEMKQKPIQF